MTRRAWLSTFIVVQVFGWCLAMNPIVARASDCANKWNAPKEVTGTSAKKADAIGDFEKKSKTLAKDANCKGDKCAKGKGNCRALRTATQSCTGDDEKGWTLRTAPRENEQQLFVKESLSLIPFAIETWGPLI